MKLTELSNLKLLAELGRRLQSISEVSVPPWARPVLVAVAAEEGILIAALMDPDAHSPAVARARHLAMAILRETRPERSAADISELFKLNHSMVPWACRRIRLLVAQNALMREKSGRILTALAAEGSRVSSPQVPCHREPLPAQSTPPGRTPASNRILVRFLNMPKKRKS